MRVCLAGAKSCPPEIGGIEVFVYELGKRLAARGFEVSALVPRRKDLKDSEDVNGISVVRVRAIQSRYLLKVSTIPGALKAARKIHPDVFHANDPPSGIVGRLGGGWKAYLMTVHGRGFSRSEWPTPFRQAGGVLQRVAINGADAVTTSDATTASAFQSNGKPIIEVNPGVDATVFQRRDLLMPSSFNESKLNLLFVGRLNQVKGIDLLLQSLGKLPPDTLSRLQLTVVGDGPLAHLVKKSRERGLPIEWVGMVPHKEIPPYFAHADILVMPSRSEGLPISMLEAMAAGLPVLATKVGGIGKAFDEIYYTPINQIDSDAVASSIRNAIDGLDAVRRKAEAARALVETDFTWDKVTERYIKIYQKIVS
jgi:glycosyltransferase involved in cell wall biosynthesis